MAKIIDLGAFIQEPLQFRLPNEEEVYSIPADLSVSFVTQIYKMQDKISKAQDVDEQMNFMQELIYAIVCTDKSKSLTFKDFKRKFDSFRVMEVILNLFTDFMGNAVGEAKESKTEETKNVKSPKE